MKAYLYLLVFVCLLVACQKKSHTPPGQAPFVESVYTAVMPDTSDFTKPKIQRCVYGDTLSIVVKSRMIPHETFTFSIYAVRQGKKTQLNSQKYKKSLMIGVLPTVYLGCRSQGFYLKFQYDGLTYVFVNDIFEFQSRRLPVFKRSVTISSSRNYVHITGRAFNEGKPIRKYNLNKNYDFDFSLQIYSIENIQSNHHKYNIFGSKSDHSIKVIDYIKAIRSDTINAKLLGDPLTVNAVLNLKNINFKTVVKWNNLAYYLEQSDAFNGAVLILKTITKKFPNRTVAYINLGDAYWGLNKKDKAQEAYRTYVKQMKKAGQTSKIPQRVNERLK